MPPQVKNTDLNYPELLHAIDSGHLRIPEFQRDFDWDMDRTLKLLDSLAKGYPIGCFLFWETTEALGSVRSIGGQPLPDVPKGTTVRYVLDGQQRITSLYAAAKGLAIGGRSYQVYCDLDADPTKEDVFVERADRSPRFTALTDVLGDRPHHVYGRLSAARKRRFDAVREAFRFTSWPVVQVSDQPLHVVCEMFERVNRGGMELDLFDIMVAKTWCPGFNLRERWDAFAAELDAVGLGRLGANTVLQALAAQLRGTIREQDILRIGRESIIDAWEQTTESIRRAVDFLRHAVPLPGTRLLPYPAIVTVLSYFMFQNDLRGPDAGQTAQLMRYYWRTGFTERYGSNPSSMVPQDLKRMRDIAKAGGDDVPVQWPLWWEEVRGQELRTSSARCRTLLSVLANCRPLDIATGVPVILDNSYLAQVNSRHYHHIFPRKWLAERGIADRVHSVANIMLVPANTNLRIGSRPPSRYMRELERKAGSAWPRWLHSHLIMAPAREALQADDFDGFLHARARAIADKANRLQGFSRDEVGAFAGKRKQDGASLPT